MQSIREPIKQPTSEMSNHERNRDHMNRKPVSVMQGKWGAIAVVVWLALGFASATQATLVVVNADFNSTGAVTPGYSYPLSGTYSGVGAAPDTGTFWNGLGIGVQGGLTATFTSGALTASDGSTPTSVTVTLNHFGVYDTQAQNDTPAGFAPALLNDLAYKVDADPPTFSIDGLVVGGTYDLYIYAQGGGFNSGAAIFTVNGNSLTVNNVPDESGFDSATADTTGNYLLFSNRIATGGTISGSFTGGNALFNGFQLTTEVLIPEPSTILLLGAGGLLLYRRAGKSRGRNHQHISH